MILGMVSAGHQSRGTFAKALPVVEAPKNDSGQAAKISDDLVVSMWSTFLSGFIN